MTPPNPAAWQLASRCKGQSKLPDGPRGSHAPLSLIHIPRTGGTTIEDCTEDEPVDDDRWGRKNSRIQGAYLFTQTEWCNRQHLPASMLPEVFAQKPERETFCVVRDPYDRILSQHGFDVGNEGDLARKQKCNVEHLNAYIKESFGDMNTKKSPYINDCHFLPQAAYAFAWDATRLAVDRSVRSCKHVLRFETLANDFDKLMEEK